MNIPDTISITIPPDSDGYNFVTYISNDNCYLAQAIREQFPDVNIFVGMHGSTKINYVRYNPKNEFNCTILENNMIAGIDTVIEMVRMRDVFGDWI